MTKSGTTIVALLAFAAGIACGFVGGIFSVGAARDFFFDAIEQERPADVTEPHTMVRPQSFAVVQ